MGFVELLMYCIVLAVEERIVGGYRDGSCHGVLHGGGLTPTFQAGIPPFFVEMSKGEHHEIFRYCHPAVRCQWSRGSGKRSRIPTPFRRKYPPGLGG